MNIGFIDKLLLLLKFSLLAGQLPARKKLGFLMTPVDATRYQEIPYFIKFLKSTFGKLADKQVLDVSSPFILSYWLSSKNAHVKKGDIDPIEASHIKPSPNLEFCLLDAKSLNFPDRSFDIVYSISVIEHIYRDYLRAIKELLRVCKPGGLIYITFPVSHKHTEEKSDTLLYAKQQKIGSQYFFQYRFCEKDVQNIVKFIKTHNVKQVEISIYWESASGTYDNLVRLLKRPRKNKYLKKIENAFLNYYYGFFKFCGLGVTHFEKKEYGTLCLIIKK